MRVLLSMTVLLAMASVPARGQTPNGPRAAPSAAHYTLQPRRFDLADPTRAYQPLAPSMTQMAADSSDTTTTQVSWRAIGGIGAVIGAWWGYNRDRHAPNQDLVPYGGLVSGAIIGFFIGAESANLFNILNRHSS